MTKKYKIQGLDCANCACEVEEAVKKYDKVSDATLSFVSETLTVETKNGFSADKMFSLIYKVEPDVNGVDIDTNEVFAQGLDRTHSYACHGDHNHHNHSHKCNCGNHSHDHAHQKCHCGHLHEHKEHSCSCGDNCTCGQHHKHAAKPDIHNKTATVNPYAARVFGGTTALVVGVLISFLLPEYKHMGTAILLLGYFFCAFTVFKQTLKKVVKGNFFNEYSLMAIATIAALCLGELYEALIVMTLYQLGELLQNAAMKNSRASIRGLLESQEKNVEVKQNNSWITFDVEQINKDDIIRLKAGSKVPVDGILLGNTSIAMDTSQITGESLPKIIHPGDEVVAGYINSNFVVEMRAISTYNTSTVAQIVETIETATEKKSHTEKLTSKFAKIYTPIMFIIAVIVVIYGLITSQFNQCLYVAAEILIISCPCALVIAVPLIYFMGIGAAARNGIIVKGANVLEQVKNIDTITLDKTGTLTDGNFALLAVQVNAAAHMTTDELLEIVAHVESCSDHPLAKIIIRDSGCTINSSLVSDVTEKPGHGVSATFDGKRVLVGNAHFMEENNISFTGLGLEATIIHVAVNNVYMGAIVLGDSLKDDATSNIRDLTVDHKKECILLSGDSQKVVDEITRKVGVKEGYGDLRPRHKVEKIQELQQEHKVLFVGDGVNDGPALATANVGVAMGKNGTDVAIETADIVLLSDKISSLNILFDLAEYVHRVADTTIAIILSAKALILILSLLRTTTMWVAIFADVGLLLIALLSAGRINRRFPKIETK